MLTPAGRAPSGGVGALLRGAALLALGAIVASLLVSEQIRVLLLLLLIVLGLLCLSPRRGVFVLLAFLPFMYFLRRQVLHFNSFASRDPILLFPPLVTLAIVTGIAVFSGPRILRYVSESALLKAILVFGALLALQMFNPIQGSILIGIGGGLYFIIPMLWTVMGLMLEERDLKRIFALVMLIGAVTALYGLYQHYFGFSDVERYELESKGVFKTFGENPRIMSTFAGLGDFSLYMATTGLICFAHYWNSRRNLIYLAVFGLTSFALLWAATRTMFFILIFSVITFLIVASKNPRLILVRGVVALIAVTAVYGYLYTFSPVDIYRAEGSHNPFIVHTIAGLAHPTEESSFQKRLSTWSYVVGRGFLSHPLGRGLGAGTTAALKFSGIAPFTVDSYFFELIYASSPLAAILFIIVMVTFIRSAFALCVRYPDNLAYRIIIAIVSGYFLGSVFGLSLRDTINSPFAWLLMGWLAREYVDHSEEEVEASPAAAPAA